MHTSVGRSGRVRIGDLITHVGATDVHFSSADVVQDLLDKVRVKMVMAWSILLPLC